MADITDLSFIHPDPTERLKRIEELYTTYKDNEPVNSSDNQKEEWFKCMTLIESNRTQLKAILSSKHFDDKEGQKNRQSAEDDHLPKYDIPDYDLIDEYKDDVFDSALDNNNGDDIASWIQEFLKEYFYIPSPSIQIPMITAFTLMNSLAAPDNEKYPRLWIYGDSGTGKSRLSEFIKYFYGGEGSSRVSYLFGTQVTPAGIRNTVDKVGRQQTATCFHWENVTPRDIMSKLAEAYTVMLTNTRATANKGIVIGTKDAGIQEFKLHTLWLLDSTAVWGNTGKEAEVRRRCVIIHTEKSEKTYQELSNWSWQKAPFKHAQLWTKEKIEKEFYPILIQCKKLSLNEGFPFKGSEYQPYYLLLATGVYTGVWSSIEQGLKICLRHKNLHDSNRIEGKPLEVIIETIIKERIRKHKLAEAEWGGEVTGAENAKRISIKDPVNGLKKQIEEVRGNLTQHDLENRVTEIMNNLGYRYEFDLKAQQGFYVRDSLD